MLHLKIACIPMSDDAMLSQRPACAVLPRQVCCEVAFPFCQGARGGAPCKRCLCCPLVEGIVTPLREYSSVLGRPSSEVQKGTLQMHRCKDLSQLVTPSCWSGVLSCTLCCRADGVESLSREASEHQDLLVIRGVEDYKNLPNKSLRLMRYALSSPAGWASRQVYPESAVHKR